MSGQRGWTCSNCGFQGRQAPYATTTDGEDLCYACTLSDDEMDYYNKMLEND